MVLFSIIFEILSSSRRPRNMTFFWHWYYSIFHVHFTCYSSFSLLRGGGGPGLSVRRGCAEQLYVIKALRLCLKSATLINPVCAWAMGAAGRPASVLTLRSCHISPPEGLMGFQLHYKCRSYNPLVSEQTPPPPPTGKCAQCVCTVFTPTVSSGHMSVWEPVAESGRGYGMWE